MGKQKIWSRLDRKIVEGDYVIEKSMTRHLRSPSQLSKELFEKKKRQFINSKKMLVVNSIKYNDWRDPIVEHDWRDPIVELDFLHKNVNIMKDWKIEDYDIITDFFVIESKNRKNNKKFGL
jgi:hypothetical protein